MIFYEGPNARGEFKEAAVLPVMDPTATKIRPAGLARVEAFQRDSGEFVLE
jgi:hypothetical protein